MPTPNTNNPRVPHTRHPATKTRDVARLRARGNTEREIACITGLPKTTVHEIIQRLKHDPAFQNFQDAKAEVFEALQYLLCSAVDQEAIKKMLERRGLTDLGILQDKIQALRGQPESITGVEIRALVGLIRASHSGAITPERVDSGASTG